MLCFIYLLFTLLFINNLIRGGAEIAYMQNNIINISIGRRFILNFSSEAKQIFKK